MMRSTCGDGCYSVSGQDGATSSRPIEDQQIGLDPNGAKRGTTGATPFWDVDDIGEAIAGLVEDGATVIEDAHDVAAGLLVAILSDADGTMIGLRQVP
jgi:predicted enzyme related to lactoylglutathione lyase